MQAVKYRHNESAKAMGAKGRTETPRKCEFGVVLGRCACLIRLYRERILKIPLLWGYGVGL